MSGGSFDYKYNVITDYYEGEMRDGELNEMIVDLRELLHDLEWCAGGDISEEDYNESKKKFKGKWFGWSGKMAVEDLTEKMNKTVSEMQKKRTPAQQNKLK